MKKVNDYAEHLLKRNKAKLPAGTARQPSGRKKRTGSVLAGKKQTIWEVKVTSTALVYHTNRWAVLFNKPLNKWTKII